MNEELRIIISAEIDKLKGELEKGKKEVEGFSKDSKAALKDYSDEFAKYGDAAKKGLAVAGAAIVGAATALLALASSTEEYRIGQAKLATAFEVAGASADIAKTTYNDLYRVLGDSDVAVEAANHLAQLTTDQKELSEWTTICQGVYATFGDSIPIEGLTEAANETAKVGAVTGSLADALNWAGVSEDDFNAKLEKCNSEAEREALIRQTLSGIYNDAAGAYEKNAAAILENNEAQAKLDETMAAIGEAVVPVQAALAEVSATILEKLTPAIQDFMDNHGEQLKTTLGEIAEAIGAVITWIADNWELVSSLAIIITGIAVALGVFSTAMTVVNTVMYASPVTWIVMAIVAALALLVTGIVLVVKHWDLIKETTVKVWNTVVDAVKVAIDKVVGFFTVVINWVKDNWQGLLLLILNPFAGAFKLVYDNCEGFRNKVNEIFTAVKDKVSEIVTNIKNAVVSKFEEIKNGITNAVTNAKNTAVNIFNNIKNSISTAVNGAKSTVTSVFDGIKNKITSSIETARDKVKTAIDKIKGFFDFKWELPKIKLPHFKINGSFSLNPPKVPSFSVNWYAQGGVFDKPTLFGYGGGSIGGLGEAGAEAVVPLENNLGWLDKLATMLNERMGGGTPIVLQVDGKVFAQTSVNAINQLTKQTGSLPLVLV